MNNVNHDDEIRDVLGNLFKVQTRYAIITALRIYKHSMNIKMLAKLLRKSESTIYHHLSVILDIQPELIEIDQEMTKNQRGIFYRLSKSMKNFYEKNDSIGVFEEEIPNLLTELLKKSEEDLVKEMIKRVKQQPDLRQVVQKARQSLAFHHALEDFALNNFEKSVNALKNGLIPVRQDFPFGGYTLLSISFKISSFSHSLKISGLISEFFSNMHKLRKEIEQEMNENNISPENMFTENYHIFGGIINEFTFKENESQ